MSYKKTCKEQSQDQDSLVSQSTLELRALCSCRVGDVYTFFERARVRTVPMLRKIKRLNVFFKIAESINLQILVNKLKLLKLLLLLREGLGFEPKKIRSAYIASDLLFADGFIDDVFCQDTSFWLMSHARTIRDVLNREEELATAFTLCKWLRGSAYPIGEHPATSLALLLSSLSHYETLRKTFPEKLGCDFSSAEYVYAQGLRVHAETAIKNLELELLLLRTWTSNAYSRRMDEDAARQYLKDELKKGRLSKRKAAQIIQKRLADELGIHISSSAVYKIIENEKFE